MIPWKAQFREVRLRFKLQKERADKWMKLAMDLKAAHDWARRWKAEAKFLSALQKRNRAELEFLIGELSNRERNAGPTEH